MKRAESSRLMKSPSRHYASKYEENYYKSIENYTDKFCPENLIHKYLEMEDKNEKLQKLKHKFSNTNGTSHMKSIHQSVVYQNDKYQTFVAPDYNLIKKGEYSTENAINVRERNPRLMNNFMKYKKNRMGLWQSSITNLPGSKLGMKENESTKVTWKINQRLWAAG